MKKTPKIDVILYRHFKLIISNNYARNISIQPVEKIFYDDNSTKDIEIFLGMN